MGLSPNVFTQWTQNFGTHKTDTQYYLPVQLNLTVWLTKHVSKIHTGSWSELVTLSNSGLIVWWRNAICVDRGLRRGEVTLWVDTYLLTTIEQLTQQSVRLSSRRLFNHRDKKILFRYYLSLAVCVCVCVFVCVCVYVCLWDYSYTVQTRAFKFWHNIPYGNI